MDIMLLDVCSQQLDLNSAARHLLRVQPAVGNAPLQRRQLTSQGSKNAALAVAGRREQQRQRARQEATLAVAQDLHGARGPRRASGCPNKILRKRGGIHERVLQLVRDRGDLVFLRGAAASAQ